MKEETQEKGTKRQMTQQELEVRRRDEKHEWIDPEKMAGERHIKMGWSWRDNRHMGEPTEEEMEELLLLMSTSASNVARS